MLHEESHPSDQDLVMAADGELSSRRVATVREHLASCWSCRARVKEIEAAITDIVHLQQRELDSKLPPIAGPRALLRARLTALAEESGGRFESWLPGLGSLVRAYRFASIAVFAASAVVLAIKVGSLVNPETHLEAAAVPKPQLTPGATVPVTKQQVCRASSLTEGPVVPTTLQQQVFAAYGISNPRRDAYEIDYLITPDLGGTANISNLWPEPYFNTRWNARVKDQLEVRLHAMVCSGEIDLATAQHDLATDWVSAYKKYFHTDRPRSPRPAVHNRTSRREASLADIYYLGPGVNGSVGTTFAGTTISRVAFDWPRRSTYSGANTIKWDGSHRRY